MAAPEISMPSSPFCVITLVRIRMLPPVEVISMPSLAVAEVRVCR